MKDCFANYCKRLSYLLIHSLCGNYFGENLALQNRVVPGQVYWLVDWTVLPACPRTLQPPPAVRTPVVVRLFWGPLDLGIKGRLGSSNLISSFN